MRKMIAGMFLAALLFGSAGAQSAKQSFVLDWLPQPEGGQSLLDRLHNRLQGWLDVVVRYTSPDIPRNSRRLWRVSVDGGGKCLLAADPAVSAPRWAHTNEILFLVDADTNGDGKIDYRDEFEVRVLPTGGAPSRAVTQAASATWSPDGKYIAIIHDGQLQVVDTSGQILSSAQRPAGRIVVSDSLNPQLASAFRAVDPQTGTNTPLPEELSKKYLWLGLMSPDGTKVVYPDATRRNILIRLAGVDAGHKLVGGNSFYLDPAWSPDAKYIVYVSTEVEGPPCGKL